MKKLLLASVLVGLSVSMPVFALDDAALAQAELDEVAWQQEWNAHDKDGDGLLSRAEAVAGNPAVDAVFDQIDTDGDGFISPAEDKAALARAKELSAP